ncbi:hypothetical protein HG531_000716 [Fusarium graminearum]|nr:hypothetical protein HG531_000716 [Fusarium graminearum]
MSEKNDFTPQVIPHAVSVLLTAQIHGLLIIGNLGNVHTGSSKSLDNIIVIEALLNSSCNGNLLEELGETRLLSTSTSKTNTVDDVEGVNHGLNGLETSSGENLHVSCQALDNLLSLTKEVVLSLAVLLLDVSKSKLLVVSTRELKEVNLGLLKLNGESLGILDVDATGGILDSVSLDTDDELGADTTLDLSNDLEDKAHAVLAATTVLISAVVCARRQELGKKITVSAVKLNAVETGLLEELGGMGEAVDNSGDILLGSGSRNTVCLSGAAANELNIGSTDRVGLNPLFDLTTSV